MSRPAFQLPASGVTTIAFVAALIGLMPPHVLPRPVNSALRDMDDHPVPVFSAPQNAIILPPFTAPYLELDASADHIVSTSEVATIPNALLRYLFPSLARFSAADALQNTPLPGDLETIVKKRSDGVLSWSWLADPLYKIGVPVIPLGLEADQNKAMLRRWEFLSRVLGKHDRFARLAARYEEKKRESLVFWQRQPHRPKVLYIYDSDPLTVAFGRAQPSKSLATVGAVNVAQQIAQARISYEEMLALAPDVLILSGFTHRVHISDLYADPRFRALPAVRAQRVYHEPSGGWRLMEGVIEEPLLFEWLTEVLYPASPARFREDLRSAYREAYNYELSDEQIDETLCLNENLRSIGYEKFMRGGKVHD
jgi:iron complex transport system substrate-binding protein